jgi:hypothetical protein
MTSVDLDLIDRYVASFEKLDDMTMSGVIDPGEWPIGEVETDELGLQVWRPLRSDTPAIALDTLYEKLPGRLPRLYEALVLRYRWDEVSLDSYCLAANPPGSGLVKLLHELSKDNSLWSFLLNAGYVRFGCSETSYDPVCFDFNSRRKNGERRIVRIDHEQVLCNERLKIVSELAPTFETLVRGTIEAAIRH